ncbi:kinase-like protein [Ganoderma leucocontextum]|nr:kinase-like protein [Ganoderma leucocontextum]
MGASARVVGAEHDGRRYAVKVIHKGAAAAAGFTRKEYLRELEVFRRIGRAPETHQFLSTLKMSWEDVSQDRILFVMDLYPTDLFSVLADGMPITLRDRQLYCRELISAVSALRDLGIVHGDIKPSNVLIDTHGRAVLSDFGNAGDASVCADGYEFWKRYVPSGTPPYMAPEVAAANVEEKGYYSASADVWSLGLVFLEIFGRYAGAYFNAWTVEDIQQEHVNLGRKGVDLKNAPLLEISRCFEILLDSMLQYYEELRPTVEELGEWNARSTSWEISLGAGHDWVPLLESSRAADERNLVNFLSFASSSAGATPSGQENSADFEYRAPGAFA